MAAGDGTRTTYPAGPELLAQRLGPVTVTEHEDTTVLTQSTIYQSVQDQDRVLPYDNAEDIHESIERLEELLARLIQ